MAVLGAWMPVPEPHRHRHYFDAKDDSEAKKKAEDYKSTIGKDYFGASVILDYLLETRAVGLEAAVKQSSAPLPKRVRFDEQLEHLVDEEENEYKEKDSPPLRQHQVCTPLLKMLREMPYLCWKTTREKNAQTHMK